MTTTLKRRPTARKARNRAWTRKERALLKDEVKVRIRHARLAANLTQQQLADLIGAERTQVVHWEAGTNRPSLKYRQPIAKATKFPLAFFDHDGRGGTTT